MVVTIGAIAHAIGHHGTAVLDVPVVAQRARRGKLPAVVVGSLVIALVPMNLGDAGVMFVFTDTAFWQAS